MFKKTCQELIGAEFLCDNATDALIVKQMCIKLHFADINCLKQYPFRILKNHSCTIHTPGRKMEHGLARWTEMSFFCWKTEPRVLTTVVCDKHCVDHKSCKKLKDIKVDLSYSSFLCKGATNHKHVYGCLFHVNVFLGISATSRFAAIKSKAAPPSLGLSFSDF